MNERADILLSALVQGTGKEEARPLLHQASSCIWVPLCSNRATYCFDTAREEIGRRRPGCRRVLLVENEHKLQLL
jgi:hypothetical protein